mmetsp:Transcript_3700/g.4133  ORF Transcript_3700/g.4133 Transcript_3700/m.4133 type:complete len:208 (+) Transcript_3700:318-941(+)
MMGQYLNDDVCNDQFVQTCREMDEEFQFFDFDCMGEEGLFRNANPTTYAQESYQRENKRKHASLGDSMFLSPLGNPFDQQKPLLKSEPKRRRLSEKKESLCGDDSEKKKVYARYSEDEEKALVYAGLHISLAGTFLTTTVRTSHKEVLKDMYVYYLGRNTNRDSSALLRHFKEIKSKKQNLRKYLNDGDSFGKICTSLIDFLMKKKL